MIKKILTPLRGVVVKHTTPLVVGVVVVYYPSVGVHL